MFVKKSSLVVALVCALGLSLAACGGSDDDGGDGGGGSGGSGGGGNGANEAKITAACQVFSPCSAGGMDQAACESYHRQLYAFDCDAEVEALLDCYAGTTCETLGADCGDEAGAQNMCMSGQG